MTLRDITPTQAPLIGTRSQSVRIGPTNVAYVGPSEIVLPEDFGGAGDNSTDNAAAFASAIAQAKTAGTTGYLGMPVGLLYGTYLTSAPLVLPRNGNTPTNVVHLIGHHDRSTVLKGTGAFPSGRAMIEWEDTPARVQHQRIANLTITLPFVAGVRAMHYKLSGTVTTELGVSQQWFNFGHIEHITVESQAGYQSGGVMRFEGGCRYTDFINVWGDPGTGANDVLLFEFDHQIGGTGTDPGIGGDSLGFEYGRIMNAIGSMRRGGYARLFKGRMFFATIEGDGSNVQGSQSVNGGYGVHVLNGYRARLRNVINEGHGESAQFRIERCRSIDIEHCGLGTPDSTDSAWVASTAYALGQRVVPTTLKGSGVAVRNAFYTCTTAGTSGATEPTWPASGTVSDGTVVWTYGGAAVGNGVELVDCMDITWDGRHATGGPVPFSNRGVKAVVMDADCERCRFERFNVVEATIGAAANEVSILAPAAVGNSISGHGFAGSLGSETVTPYGVGAVDLRGSGSPEGVITAGVGSRYIRLDGGTSTTLYLKESGTSNIGWRAV